MCLIIRSRAERRRVEEEEGEGGKEGETHESVGLVWVRSRSLNNDGKRKVLVKVSRDGEHAVVNEEKVVWEGKGREGVAGRWEGRRKERGFRE